ncbi:hypothetical protein [Armatimonas sp.]|uniref:hypothetical protein n=1 Tax=Armatimonas sp. TaxID=1872638 RepID=UPI00286A4E13|nr:hypothetical protein [Armatimonas sp.]
MTIRRTHLLWIDCTGGFLVGVAVLLARGWLARLYALPDNLLLVMGACNLAYACFSYLLAVAPRYRTKSRIGALALANLCWAVGCFVMGAIYLRVASVFGLVHLIGEGIYVGALGILEWRTREALAMR